jgi:uncharacterized membrane protein
MLEVLGTLLLFGFVAALVVCFIVLPSIAYQRIRQLPALVRRIERLEEAVARLRDAGRPAAPAAEPLEVVAVEPPPPRPTARPELRPDADPAARRRRPQPGLFQPLSSAELEAWIGRQGLGWVAVILLLIGTAFFLKYAFENRWIGELGRVALGIAAGAGLCVAGWRCHRRGRWLFGQMLTAAGIALLYLATFGAFGYYHLLGREPAAVFLIILTAEAAALALAYESPAIAIMAVVAGLLNPVLLHTDRDQYPALFTYLIVLDAGVVAVLQLRRWPAVGTLALAGTQGLFWAWWDQHYHPEKLTAALLFQAGVFALFLAEHAAAPLWRRHAVGKEGAGRAVLNALLFSAAAYVLLQEDYRPWLGSLAVAMAIPYAALGWLVLRRQPQDAEHLAIAVAVAV